MLGFAATSWFGSAGLQLFGSAVSSLAFCISLALLRAAAEAHLPDGHFPGPCYSLLLIASRQHEAACWCFPNRDSLLACCQSTLELPGSVCGSVAFRFAVDAVPHALPALQSLPLVFSCGIQRQVIA
ncbi:hypothetical protein PF001_g19968, partial [Phytophthora fragariae]